MKKHSRTDHPCLSCPLPDCNDKHPGCLLRKALNEHGSRKNRGLPVDEDLKRRRSIAYHEFYYWEKREKARLRKEAAESQGFAAPIDEPVDASLMTADQASSCLRLWLTKQFDTLEIAQFLSVDEHVVCRTIQAARDIIREGRL